MIPPTPRPGERHDNDLLVQIVRPCYIVVVDDLTDAEFALLLLMAEQPGITGYGITRLVAERGLGAWAGLAPSSVYTGLKRVEDRALACSVPDESKSGRGPRGRCYRVTTAGRRAVRQAVQHALSTAREYDPRVNLALSGLDLLDPESRRACLEERATYLAAEHARVSAIRDGQGHPPASPAGLLFDRILHAIDAERAWSSTAAGRLRTTTHGKDRP